MTTRSETFWSVAELDDRLTFFLGAETGAVAIKKCSPRLKREFDERVYSMCIEAKSIVLRDQFVEIYNSMVQSEQTVPIASRYDVLVDDISDHDLECIGMELGYTRLSLAEDIIPFPIKGLFWKSFSNRMFIPLCVKGVKNKHPLLHVLFLVNPGCPQTFLRQDTLDALFPEGKGRKVARVNINGLRTPMEAHVSHGLFENIDMLGQDFLEGGGYDLVINYHWHMVKIYS